MNIHIITVSLAGNVLECQPDRCEVDKDGVLNLIVWRLDENTLENAEFVDIDDPAPGFRFDDAPPPGRFQLKNIDTRKRHISIMNLHFKKPTPNKWEYTLRVRKDGRDYETQPIRGNHPVIINR